MLSACASTVSPFLGKPTRPKLENGNVFCAPRARALKTSVPAGGPAILARKGHRGPAIAQAAAACPPPAPPPPALCDRWRHPTQPPAPSAQAFGCEHPRFAAALVHLGTFYTKQGVPLQALPFFQRALTILTEAGNPMHEADVARVHYELAANAYHLGHYKSALEQFKACQGPLERCFGPQDAAVVDCQRYILGMEHHRYPDPSEFAAAELMTIPEPTAPRLSDGAEDFSAEDAEHLQKLLNKKKFQEALPIMRRSPLSVAKGGLAERSANAGPRLSGERDLYGGGGQGFFRIIKNQGGGGPLPKTPSPPPQTKVTIVGKTKFTIGKIWSGHFWYTKFWVQNPLPPSPPCSKEALGGGGGGQKKIVYLTLTSNFAPLLINFILFPRNSFLMWVGGWGASGGGAQAALPPPPLRPG